MRFLSHESKGAKTAGRPKLSLTGFCRTTLKMSEAKTERGTLWGDNEVIALIEIWADEGIQQQLDSCTRKRPILQKIARRLIAKDCKSSLTHSKVTCPVVFFKTSLNNNIPPASTPLPAPY